MANTAAVTGLVTFEDAKARIGVLPTLEPRPNATNLRTLKKHLVEALQGLPSYASVRYGYMGMVVSPEEYALTGEPPFRRIPDPGAHRPLGGSTTPQRDNEVTYNASKNVFLGEANVQQAINTALNAAVPKAFRRAQEATSEQGFTQT